MFVTQMVGAGPLRVFTDYDYSNIALAQYTFSVDIGTPTSDRVVAIALCGIAPDEGANLVSVTINGITADVDAYAKGINAPFNRNVMSAIASASVPTGTTVSVVCTFDPDSFLQIEACGIGVYALYNLLSPSAPFSANAAGNNSNSGVSTTINVPSNGISIASSGTYFETGSISMTGVTQDFQQVLIVSGRVQTVGSSENMNAQTGRTIAQVASSAFPSSIAAASWS